MQKDLVLSLRAVCAKERDTNAKSEGAPPEVLNCLVRGRGGLTVAGCLVVGSASLAVARGGLGAAALPLAPGNP